jgi:putative transposase
MRDQLKAEEIAEQRVQLLSPLLMDNLDAAQAKQIKDRICEQAGISERTLRRYLAQYQAEGFSGLKPKGRSRRRSDSKPIRFLDAETITNAFLHCEERKIDKAGCISFEGKKYEVGLNFIGCKVAVVYDPADTTELTIEYEGHTPWKAKQLVIGERSGERPHLPEQLLPESAESSRLLAAAAKKNKERKEQRAPAVSYRAIRKEEGDGHV